MLGPARVLGKTLFSEFIVSLSCNGIAVHLILQAYFNLLFTFVDFCVCVLYACVCFIWFLVDPNVD